MNKADNTESQWWASVVRRKGDAREIQYYMKRSLPRQLPVGGALPFAFLFFFFSLLAFTVVSFDYRTPA